MKAEAPAFTGASTARSEGFHQSNGRGLSERIARLLRWGDIEGKYQSRSEVLMAILTEMVRQRWPADTAWETLRSTRNSGGEALRTDRHGRVLSMGRATRRFHRDWDRAEQYVASLPDFRDRYDVVQALADMRMAADSHPWPGRAGATDRVVLGTLLDIAMTAGRTVIHASVRTVAEMAGCAPGTAGRSLERLRKSGWISRQTRSKAALAARWKIKGNRTGQSGFGGDTSGPEGLLVDTWCWAGLGWSKGRIYAQLNGEVTSTSQIAGALRVTPRTVRKHLAVLRDYGLAVHEGDGWIRGPVDPADVAQVLGTKGRQEASRELYRRSREQFRARTVPPGVDPETGEVRNRTGQSGLPLRGGVTDCRVEFPSRSSDDLDRAEAVIRQVFGDDHVTVVEEAS